MSHSEFFKAGVTYRVLADPSVLLLARPAPAFKKGELVRIEDIQHAIKEGYAYLTFHMFERDPDEYGRIYIYDRDPEPEPDWSKYFEKV